MPRLSFFVLLLLTISAGAQSNNYDTIRAGDGQLNLKYLPKGPQNYIVYVSMGSQKRGVSIWERNTSIEEWHGKQAIVIRQLWSSSDTTAKREIFSVSDPKTFVPLYHTSANLKTGKEAFNFSSTEIMTADSVADVSRKEFKHPLSEASFNWELDIETFPLLPLKEGKTFVINFYHPGSTVDPAWYNYSVIGTETVQTVNGGSIDCFKLFTDYGNNRGNSTWWLSKKTHEIIKMEEHFGKITRYKMKISVTE